METGSGSDLGGLQIPPAASSEQSNNPTGGDVSASSQHIKQRKERSDKGQPRGARGAAVSPSVQQLSQVQFAALYSPALWEKTLCAPADAAAAITGKAYWEVSQKERDAVGATGAIAAQCFAVSDPKWLALSLCAVTILEIYGVRLGMMLAEKKKEAEEAKRKKAAGTV